MFESVLLANRGLLACRVTRTLKRLGIRVIAVHSEADRYAKHVLAANRAVCVGASPKESYAHGAAILDAAKITGASAIHAFGTPLGHSPTFARAVESSGLTLVGPTADQVGALCDPIRAAEIARDCGIPTLPPGAVLRERQLRVNLFGDGRGKVLALGAHDCSARRLGVTVLAETPAATLQMGVRKTMCDAAVALFQKVRYRGVGTVDLVYDLERGTFYLGAVHAELGLEHGLTEAVLGIDLVEWMVRAASGDPPSLENASLAPDGCAFQARLYAADPLRGFSASTGLLTELRFPTDARVEAAYGRGDVIDAQSDPLLATVTVRANTRAGALAELSRTLEGIEIGGIETNLSHLAQIVEDPLLAAGEITTRSFETIAPESTSIEVLSPGPLSIVVDHPGRLGYWAVGIPPSGPMDVLAHRFANRVVGNPEHSASLELTLSGPKLQFHCDACIALAGARMPATLDGVPIAQYRPIRVRAGQILAIGPVEGAGCRAYLAIRGGVKVPAYLGSRTTFTLGGFGGHGGRALRASDVLHVGDDAPQSPPRALPQELIPEHHRHWKIGVLYGPHGAPDFFTENDVATLFSTDWEVHFNSNRTGVRLLGPRPEWARRDGGEAGLHPSNIHDVAYAVGAIDFTGDMPILLGPDGPSLGGFVCPATVVAAELWKLGQLKAGDRVRFIPITDEAASELEAAQDRSIGELEGEARSNLESVAPRGAVVLEADAPADGVRVVYRRSGDKNLLVEYGPLVLDLRLRFRVHALMQWLADARIAGIIDLTPGIRSLQIHYDSRVLSTSRLLDALTSAERELPETSASVVPTRIVHMPLSWDDPATRLAIAKYVQSVRRDAPWCPSNIEFIRRINGLDSIQDVYDTVFQASYLVLGLGDVYLGAPVATPIDPRHRLVTTKYNPARTWTPENAVGIGGAYLCVYGMEGPGGYQFVGRTLQVYNRFRKTKDFSEGSPWLLRFFDQIRFYPVNAETLLEMREAFPHGSIELRIEEGEFRLSDYERFLAQNDATITGFKARQQAAFDAERQRWVESGQLAPTAPSAAGSQTSTALSSRPEGT